MKSKLQEAIQFRADNRPEESIQLLRTLLLEHPKDPNINLQMAWTCDSMGKEKEAVLYYETAISAGLTEGRLDALLGLGSTYRCLGEYTKSIKIFDQAILEFPQERALRVFRALTLFNLHNAEKSIEELLIQLLDTTTDSSIKSYDRALRFYSDKLSETWK